MKIEIIEQQFDPWQQVVDYKRDKLLNNPKIGASSVFLGTMRDYNEGEEVERMFLEHYPDMTEKYLEEIVNTAIKKHKILDGLVIHRVGEIIPTDPIVLVATWSEHRAASFDATSDSLILVSSSLHKKESIFIAIGPCISPSTSICLLK